MAPRYFKVSVAIIFFVSPTTKSFLQQHRFLKKNGTPQARKADGRRNCIMSSGTDDDEWQHQQDDGGGDEDSYQRALEQAEDKALRNFVDRGAPAWLKDQQFLPFACTGCGKCCQTEGSVYMSPPEIQNAADLLRVSVKSFIQQYASHTISGGDQTWIRLREQQNDVENADKALTSSSCVFLDLETKYCQIYEARPTQCSTYPFWPSIMMSPGTWNGECRSRDDVVENSREGRASSLPAWSPEAGGCEGMIPMSASGGVNGEEEELVPLTDAYRQLYASVLGNRRFQAVSGEETPVDKCQPTSKDNEGLNGST